MNTILMYVVQNEQEIPNQILPNTAYYILGKEIRLVDNMGKITLFTIPKKEDEKNKDNFSERLDKCEKNVEKIIKHLTSFGG